METIVLKGIERKELGKKSAKLLRKSENVPCVIYGGEEVVHFSIPELDLKKLIFTHKVYLLKIKLDGKEYDALLQDIQFHPVTDRIIHVDFKQIIFGKEVITYIPINLTGDSVGIKKGGKLRQKRRGLKVKGLPVNLPDILKIDITDLDIGDSFKVGDLSYENLTLLDPHRSMVVGIASSRLAKGMEEGVVEEEVEEGAEEVEEGAEATEEAKAASEGPAGEDKAREE